MGGSRGSERPYKALSPLGNLLGRSGPCWSRFGAFLQASQCCSARFKIRQRTTVTGDRGRLKELHWLLRPERKRLH